MLEDASAGRPGTHPTEVDSHVGSLLRVLHESVLNEPVPERFLDLLRQIDAKGEAEVAAALAKPG
jgi:hypothetical protein